MNSRQTFLKGFQRYELTTTMQRGTTLNVPSFSWYNTATWLQPYLLDLVALEVQCQEYLALLLHLGCLTTLADLADQDPL